METIELESNAVETELAAVIPEPVVPSTLMLDNTVYSVRRSDAHHHWGACWFIETGAYPNSNVVAIVVDERASCGRVRSVRINGGAVEKAAGEAIAEALGVKAG